MATEPATARPLNSYWASMSAEERSAEMKRRRAKAKGKKRKVRSTAKKYQCSKCNKKFDDQYMLANHVRYAHPKKKLPKGAPNGSSPEAQGELEEADISNHIHFAFGSISKELTNIASGAGISRTALALGVAELLRHSEGR